MSNKQSADPVFTPSAHMLDIQGRDYLPVAARVVWMRREHADWSILTEPVAIADGGYMRATILNDMGRVLATAHKAIRPGGRGAVGQYPIESAETGAVGRALGLCGYGTLAGDLDEGDELADSPVEAGEASPAAVAGHKPADWERQYDRSQTAEHVYRVDEVWGADVGAGHPLVVAARERALERAAAALAATADVDDALAGVEA